MENFFHILFRQQQTNYLIFKQLLKDSQTSITFKNSVNQIILTEELFEVIMDLINKNQCEIVEEILIKNINREFIFFLDVMTMAGSVQSIQMGETILRCYARRYFIHLNSIESLNLMKLLIEKTRSEVFGILFIQTSFHYILNLYRDYRMMRRCTHFEYHLSGQYDANIKRKAMYDQKIAEYFGVGNLKYHLHLRIDNPSREYFRYFDRYERLHEFARELWNIKFNNCQSKIIDEWFPSPLTLTNDYNPY